MRIISKFSDFYDCGVAYGVDPAITYVRKTKELGDPYTPRRGYVGLNRWKSTNPKVREVGYLRGTLHFCGKAFSFQKFTEYGQTFRPLQVYYVWNKEQYETLVLPRDRYGLQFNFTVTPTNTNLQYGSPIVIEWLWDYFIINPCLKEIGFSSIMDPFQAFQEISMYLAGPLNNWVDPQLEPEPSEKENVQRHGFTKQSFRKR